jgi:V/A-type H+/Na+-transporting ATPase subunit C
MLMQGVSTYSAVHARVRAMAASQLTPAAWRALYETPSYSALIDGLKNTVYGYHLGRVDPGLLTSRRAVYQMKMHLSQACAKIASMLPRETRFLLLHVYRLFEVDNLKAVLRGVAAGASWDQVRFVLFPMNGYTVLPAQEMVEANSVASAIDLLRGTPYYDTLAHALGRYAAEQSLFPLEVALDLAYWRVLWRYVNVLSQRDREQARRLIGSLIDANNLMWAIRYRVYHGLSEEEIINYTLPFGYRVHDQDIRAIASGADIAGVLARVYPDLGDVSEQLKTPGQLPMLELDLQRRLLRQCRGAFVGYPFHVGVPLAYLLLVELEIQDLTVLVEAKSMGADPGAYLPYLLAQPFLSS